MAKRTTTSTGTVKRTRKTAARSRTTRRPAAKPAAAAKPVEAAAPAEAVNPVVPVAAAAAAVEPAPHIEPTTEQIAERAYFLSLERKGPGGPLDDWLQAERELRNGSAPV